MDDDRTYRRAFRLERASRRDVEASVDDELDFHLESAVDELVASGWPPEQARQEALRQFGDLEYTRGYCADMQTRRGRVERRTMFMDQLWQDLRYALRTLRTAPGYAGLVVLTLAFGIAANTTIFSVMNPYFFRPLPYADPDGLVHVTQVEPVTGWDMDRFSLPIYEDWRARSRAFQDLAAYTYGGTNITGPEGPEGVTYGRVTANMFDVLGVQAAVGRTFAPDEGRPGAEPVVVVGHALWQRRYLGDPALVGRTITLDGVAHTVIGIMPEDFNFPFGSVRLWTAERASAAGLPRDRTPYLLVGRLAEGWTGARADDELTAIQRELAAVHPKADGRWTGVTVLPMRQALNFAWEQLTAMSIVLFGAVFFVLAIACVNVASLTLARASARVREVSVRAAMGAPRARIVRQLLTESLVLAALGGAVGVALAYGAAGAIGPVIPEDLYKVGRVDIDRTVLAFSLLVTVATPLLFGLAPALTAARRDLVDGLKEGAKGSGGLGTSRGRRVLVSVQVALAVILITGAGLMLRSFAAVQEVDLGFDGEGTVYVTVQPAAAEYTPDEATRYVERAIAEMEAVPGVAAASATLFIPLNNETSLWQFAPPEMSGTPGEEWPTAIANRPYPGYFEALDIPVLQGRDFAPSDNRDAAPVAIVNEPLAERYWPGESPVGRTLLLGDPAEPLEVTVVGVVGAVRHDAVDGDGRRAQVYRPALQTRFRRHFLVARTAGDPAAIVGPIRQAVAALDADVPFSVRPMSEIVRQSQLQWSLGSLFLGAFGGGALLLATLGIYGLISFSVAQRQRELGVRIALGATRGDIRSVVLGDGVRLTVIGLAFGLVAAVGLAQAVAPLFFGVTPFDPATLSGVLVLFLAVAAAASLVPAEKASRTDPIGVLRTE